MKDLKVYRKYNDEKTWEEIPLEQALRSLGHFFEDAELVIEDLFDGETVYTDVAAWQASAVPL
jgi:hypothetical protein